MKAVVMAGGEGTRLRPLTSSQPKPMVPIVGKPCLEHVLDLLALHGFDEIVVTLAFLPQSIRSYFGDGESLGLTIDYSIEEQPLGTAGSVRLAGEPLDDTFLVISGDALCDVDLTALVRAHREHGAAVTIGLERVEDPLEFGIVVTDAEGRVERFLEKPSWGEVFSDTINTGIYVLEPDVLRHIPRGQPFDFSHDLFPLLLELGLPIHGHVLDGYWQDVGTLEQFRQANVDALDGRVQLRIPGLLLRGSIWVAEDVDIDDLESIEGPAFIGANCRVAQGSSIGAYTVLSRGVTVREGARITRSVVDAFTYVGPGALVDGAIVGRGCELGDHVCVHEGVAIGDQVSVGREATLYPGVRVYPFKEIETAAEIHESVVWETRSAGRVFGEDGVTGLVDVDLTPEVAVRLAAALGTSLRRGDRVVASRDSADACRMIQRAIIAGLTSTGVHVADLRVSPVPVTRHVLRTQAFAAGVHVSRSSAAAELVHVRVFESPGTQMTAERQKEVEKHYARRELRRAAFGHVGQTTYPARVRESYAQDLLDAVDVARIRERRLRVAVDYGYSAATFTLPLVLGPLGVEVIAIRGTIGGDESAEELATADVRRVVSGVGADLGAVVDRAAERLVLVDERGREVDLQRALLLFVRLLAGAGRRGRVVVPVTVTGLVEEIADGTGLVVVRTRHALGDLTRAAAEEGVLFAGAASGGYVFPGVVPGYDAVAALGVLLELLAISGRTLSEVVDGLPQPTLVRRAVPCPWGRKGTVMRVLAEQLADRELELTDGVKAFDDRGWVQALPDPDAPLVLLFAEGATPALSAELADELAATVVAAVQGDGPATRTVEQTSS